MASSCCRSGATSPAEGWADSLARPLPWQFAAAAGAPVRVVHTMGGDRADDDGGGAARHLHSGGAPAARVSGGRSSSSSRATCPQQHAQSWFQALHPPSGSDAQMPSQPAPILQHACTRPALARPTNAPPEALPPRFARRYHQYKFIVDGEWRHDESQPFMPDPLGNVNNWLFVRKPEGQAAPAAAGHRCAATRGSVWAPVRAYAPASCLAMQGAGPRRGAAWLDTGTWVAARCGKCVHMWPARAAHVAGVLPAVLAAVTTPAAACTRACSSTASSSTSSSTRRTRSTATTSRSSPACCTTSWRGTAARRHPRARSPVRPRAPLVLPRGGLPACKSFPAPDARPWRLFLPLGCPALIRPLAYPTGFSRAAGCCSGRHGCGERGPQRRRRRRQHRLGRRHCSHCGSGRRAGAHQEESGGLPEPPHRREAGRAGQGMTWRLV